MSARCITPAHPIRQAGSLSDLTRHDLVAGSGILTQGFPVYETGEPILLHPRHIKEHAVRVELTISGFADRRLNRLGYACETLELRAGVEPALRG